MKFEYDPEADAGYLQILDGTVTDTREIADNFYLDIDAEGRLLGIEILSMRAEGARLVKEEEVAV